MNIDLNNEEFDGGGNVSIFNNGKAGIVNDVTLTIEKKKADDKENAPDYKLIFTDSSGSSCNASYWYVTDATEYSSVEQLITKQGKVLKHISHAVLGDDFSFPTYKNAKEMLNGIMKLVKEGLANSGTFRVFANYGTKEYCKKYIQPRSWVPFMEPMTIAEDDTRLKGGDFDAMERLKEDTFVDNGAVSAGAKAGDDDWD